MELKIEVDETKFKDVIENELKAFSKDELHEIIRECIVEYLRKEKTLKNLFVKEDYNYGYITEKPSALLVDAAKSVDLSPAYKEIQELMINTLKENHSKLIKEIMLDLMLNGIFDSNNFNSHLEEAIRSLT